MAASSVVHGRTVVGTPGTPVQLTGQPSGVVDWVVFTALSTNTTTVTIGGSNTVRTAAATRNGLTLAAGASSPSLASDDLSDFWVDAGLGAEGVSWTAGVRA